jgi:hypothetical protein
LKKYIVVFITLVIVFLMIPLSALAFTPAENYPPNQGSLYPNDVFHSPHAIGDNKNWALIKNTYYHLSYGKPIKTDSFYYVASDKPFIAHVDFVMNEKYDISIVYGHNEIDIVYGHITDTLDVERDIFRPFNRDLPYRETDNFLYNKTLYKPDGELFSLWQWKDSWYNSGVYDITSPTIIYSGDVEIEGSGFKTDMLNGIMDDIKPGVNILLPANNFSQSQIDKISTTFTYKVPCANETMYDQINIKVDGYKKGTTDVDIQEFKVKYGYAYGLYKVSGDVGFGEGREIKVTVTDPYGKKWYDKVTVHCYEGFVDEDEDGIDDRSFDDFWDSPANPINQEKPDISINDVASLFNGIKTFFEGLWGILPQPIYVVLIGGLMVLIAVGILRAVLG